jgi:signal transduction histidine kinase
MDTELNQEVFRVLFTESKSELFIFREQNWEISEFNENFSHSFKYDRYENKKLTLKELIKEFSESHPVMQFVKSDAPSGYLKDVIVLDRHGLHFTMDLQITRLLLENPVFLCEIIYDSDKKETLRLNYEYISNISHELRGPLTNINGTLDILQKNKQDILDNESLSLFSVVQKNLKRMKVLLDNLLLLDIKKKKYSPEVYSPCTSINEAIAFFEPSILEKNLLVNKDIDCSVLVRGDKFEFSQILHNLLSNAIKYTNKGEIKISVSKHSEKIARLEISDTGIGIPQEFNSSLFNRFFRVSSSVGGVGLGLWIVKELVERMQGTIQMYSTLGVGTTFILDFPLVDYAS